MIDLNPEQPDPLETLGDQMDCDHKDSWGSTIIIGEHSGDFPVCMNCGMRFPDLPRRFDRLDDETPR